MDDRISLKDAGVEIKAKFFEYLSDLESQYEQLLEKQQVLMNDLCVALSRGDLSENAEYKSAKDELESCAATLCSLNEQLKKARTVKADNLEYQPIGIVVMFTTVRLKNSYGNAYTMCLYPKGISDLSRGILSVDSVVGKSLWYKRIGDTFVVEHRITGELITWEVEDIY